MKIILSASEKIMIESLLNTISFREHISLDKINKRIATVENSVFGDCTLDIDSQFVNKFISILSNKSFVAIGILMSARGLVESFAGEMDTLVELFKEEPKKETKPADEKEAVAPNFWDDKDKW